MISHRFITRNACSIITGLVIFFSSAKSFAQTSFQPYRSPGNNLVHISTVDWWGAGGKEYIAGMTVEGKVVSFPLITGSTNIDDVGERWSYDMGQFGFHMESASIDNTAYEKILIPCADGHLRIFDKDGLHLDLDVSKGALYCVGVGQVDGSKRIVAGGVDGKLYIFDGNGNLKTTKTMADKGLVRRVVIGDYDGDGTDEIVVFIKRRGFSASASNGGSMDVLTLDDAATLNRPSYWTQGGTINDNIPEDWYTDKQLPSAYDIDGDGNPEVIGHWGVMHPENATSSRTDFLLMLDASESLSKSDYENYNTVTPTGNQYIMQKAIPGNFRHAAGYRNSELFTFLGDDLFFMRHNGASTLTFKEYGYSHTLYHFTDAARLESSVGALDKIVLSGPNNGDDRFYIVDLSDGTWSTQAKLIHTDGPIRSIESEHYSLTDEINNFSGEPAAGEPINILLQIGLYPGWWDMSDASIEAKADEYLDHQRSFNESITGDPDQKSERVNLHAVVVAPFGDNANPNFTVTHAGMIKYFEAVAERELYICYILGKNNSVYYDDPETVADFFEALVKDGESYMSLRVFESTAMQQLNLYTDVLDALISRAETLGIDPPKMIFDGKGPCWTTLDEATKELFFGESSPYKDLIILSSEESNNRLPEWAVAERMGLWMSGFADAWCGVVLGDALTPNRTAEWTAMRNGHIVFRRLISEFALGARWFRISGEVDFDNPMYPEIESDPLSSPDRGIMTFLQLVEKGIYPASPEPRQIKGISPVAVALPTVDSHFNRNNLFHDWDNYNEQASEYVLNDLACWDAYKTVSPNDATAFLYGTKTRWANLFPNSPSGFVVAVPLKSRAALESQSWCNRAYETDSKTWAEFGSVSDAAASISAELIAQRSNLLFYVDGDCSWQVTEDKNDENILYVVMMDREVLTPAASVVNLKMGSASNTWDVYDQLDGEESAIGTLASANESLSINIPAGSVRLLLLKKRQPQSLNVAGIAWDGAATPAFSLTGISGEMTAPKFDATSNSTDGHFGGDWGFEGASIDSRGTYSVLGNEHNANKSSVDLSITNNTGSDLLLETVRFDYSQWYDESPSQVRLIYVSGGLTIANDTVLKTVTASGPLGKVSNYDDINFYLENIADNTLAAGESAQFCIEAFNASSNNTRGGIDNIAIGVSGSGIDHYEAWMMNAGVYGSNASAEVDNDSDSINNRMEYVLVGNPAISDVKEIVPQIVISEEGSSTMEFVYRRRSDFRDLGLTYLVESNTSLDPESWISSNLTVVEEGVIDENVDFVRCRIPMGTAGKMFVRLRVEWP